MRFTNLSATAKQRAIRDYISAWDNLKDNSTEKLWDEVEDLLAGYNEEYNFDGILIEE